MITHDIDEAILLADRILLMTNGPFARVAESVEITIRRPRNRIEIVEHPNYYAIRNHLVQFLGKHSKELAGPTDAAENRPETVRIDKTAPAARLAQEIRRLTPRAGDFIMAKMMTKEDVTEMILSAKRTTGMKWEASLTRSACRRCGRIRPRWA
jgi:ABC-type proline/glycine betaine transport system ATPase subunit